MYIEPKLKPLFANLKRLNIGEYLETKEFQLFMLESGIDDMWENCKREVNKGRTVVMLGFHSTEDDELALMYFMSAWYAQRPENFAGLILPILHNFALWKPIKIDYKLVIASIRNLGVPSEQVDSFYKTYENIQKDKPNELKPDAVIVASDTPLAMTASNKIFVVHGHDAVSRLELCNILKDDFKLDPVVLQDKPNNSIDTIIGKFERLASECSSAIILFTPDDDAGPNKRARQNVIFELGYFLGKFQANKDRKVIILKKGSVEIPSDIAGVLYLSYENSVTEIFYQLRKQFQHWGYSF